MPLRPDPDPARQWLEEELRRPEYHQQGLLERLVGWLSDAWDEVTTLASGAGVLSAPLAVGLLLVIVGLAVWVSTKLRREPARPSVARAVLGGDLLSADALRARAEQARGEGRDDDALVDATRALAARMSDRGLVTVTPGTTAHEVAIALGSPFPDRTGALRRMATLFDVVFYGHGHASATDAQQVLDLDAELRSAQPRGDQDRHAYSGRAPR